MYFFYCSFFQVQTSFLFLPWWRITQEKKHNHNQPTTFFPLQMNSAKKRLIELVCKANNGVRQKRRIKKAWPMYKNFLERERSFHLDSLESLENSIESSQKPVYVSIYVCLVCYCMCLCVHKNVAFFPINELFFNFLFLLNRDALYITNGMLWTIAGW